MITATALESEKTDNFFMRLNAFFKIIVCFGDKKRKLVNLPSSDRLNSSDEKLSGEI
jgi:hypothetical protein